MKKNICVFCVVVFAVILSTISTAQEGYVYIKAGCFLCNRTPAEGVLATTAYFSIISGIGADSAGNIYISDHGPSYHRVRKINAATGLINTIAGTGSAGFTGDGGPAINAQFKFPVALHVSPGGDVYVADQMNLRIRKISGVSGVINTVAGGGISTADGVPATTASIGEQNCVAVDRGGNIYCSGQNCIRKIDVVTGLITTVAGNGTSGPDAGDGGPAINAVIPGPLKGIAVDAANNIYFVSDNGAHVRKVTAATGIVNTVAGLGISLADGIPAVSAQLVSINSIGVDAVGNLYIADDGQHKIKKVDAGTGLINSITSGNVAIAPPDSVPAITAQGNNRKLFVSASGDIYFTTPFDNAHKIIGSPTFTTDSFSVYLNHDCNGPTLSVYTHQYAAGIHVKTYFGDNDAPTDVTLTNVNNTGYALMNHTYAATGIYTIKQVLYYGNIKLDSLQFTYEHIFCNAISVQFYNDANGNCSKDVTEVPIVQPILIEVDSNYVPIDTISVMSGFYYNAFGVQGDIYDFKVIQTPPALQTACPVPGSVTMTLQDTFITPIQYIGFNCLSVAFDLSADAVIPVTGINDQWGNIYVSNNSCLPTNATVTLNFSPKYEYTSGASPTPSSTLGNSITWDITGLSADNITPTKLHYQVVPSAGPLTINDTVQTHIVVTPTTGDINPSNNVIIIHDTVKGSCDPNHIEVTPVRNILSGDQLKYRIEFENVGNDTAFNIYVQDTLPDELDANSMRIISSTHAMYVSPYQAAGHNIVKFDFPDIDLLDSSYHGECTGTFTYTIMSKTGLVDGTLIPHRVGIYFDNNAVVLTNTVENIIGWPAGVTNVSNEDKVQLYPNPANNELTIRVDKALYSSCTITNSMGQVVIEQQMNGVETKVNVKGLVPGMYYVNMVGDKGSVVRKFVKR